MTKDAPAVALVTDSSTQVPASMVARHHIWVVPTTVVVDGVAYLEGVDLDPEWFVERLVGGSAVSTAAPSPGQMAATYAAAAAAGAAAIVSVHVGSALSGTLGAASLAAGSCALPVDLVDTGSASFAAGCCVWAAAEALDAGGHADDAAGAARRAAADIDNVFIVSSLRRARTGGRLAPANPGSEGPVPVLALRRGQLHQVASVDDPEAALECMTAYVQAATSDGRPVRMGVGDTDCPELADSLARRLRPLAAVTTLVRYHVGPSVSAHTGPGSVGAVFTPI